jgi:hypothetical protein
MKTKEKLSVKADQPKHKGGRPKVKVRRETHVKVRLTATEHFLIKTKAKEAGMRISDWFRAAARSAKVVPRIKPEDRNILHMLAGLANNFNQVTKLAHIGGLLSIARKCDGLLTEIDEALKYFNNDDRQNT